MAPGERSFHFEPIKPKLGRIKSDFEPYVKLQKGGVMVFGKKTLEYLKITGPIHVRLFQDVGKRALGFQLQKSVTLGDATKEAGYRLLTPRNYTGTVMAVLSIQSFLSELSNVTIPSPRLVIKKYNDTDGYLQYGEIWYVKVPYGDEKKRI